MSYYLEPVSENNLEDIKYLIKSIYDRDSSIETIGKKYDTSGFGEYTVGYIAYHEETKEPSAYYGVFPIVFEYKGKKILAAQSGDTMTHPNHRRKGLFTKLAKETYELAKAKGVEFVFGFPVEASYYGFVKKLDWKHDNDIQKYDFFTLSIPYSYLFKKHHNKIASFLLKGRKNKDSYPNSNIDLNLPKIERSTSFYEYKNKEGNFNVNFLGLKIWFHIKGVTMIIADLEFGRKTSIRSVIFKLRVLATILGVVRVSFHLTNNSSLNDMLKSKYKNKKGLAVGYVNFSSELPLNELCFTYADFDTF
ncbi:GNAT family N-acetyltransferase [uncultured Tenacibaculum sp.]|uniref:GNAT family N-acetyltransferase n=1 Tax=uncultured Tenacibaculum sp. TaxID=174713 RepID=UPI00262543F6|nr:GNAT family N-acetyltransferase [uncultured Tenacibaculum sp.]